MAIGGYWLDADWDQLTLGSTSLPGIWEVEGGVERRVDVKTQKGSDGANIKDEGYQNADVVLVGRMTERAQWEALEQALKEIHPRRKGAARDPLVLVHPAAAILGITAVYVIRIDAPTLNNGVLEVRIGCLEWIPKPKPKAAKRPVPISKEDQQRANRRFSLDSGYVRGRVLTLPNGQQKVDLGIPPPRDSALDFLQDNPTSGLSELQGG